MKTLLFSTDFSANANHAAEYGYNIARQIKANIVLCNAVVVPAEMPQAGLVVWPMDEYDILMDGSAEDLKKLEQRLEAQVENEAFKPAVICISEAGTVIEVINNAIEKQDIDMVVVGTHANKGLSGFIMGNHASRIIDEISRPVLLVPSSASVKPIKKIAFATDFKQSLKDLDAIYKLVPFARALNAEILLTHVYDEKELSPELQKEVTTFLTELSNKADYPNIFYRIIKNSNTENGLEWLCEHGQTDMLAMVHREHGFLDNVLKGSHTKKMADHAPIPLLVFKEGQQ